MKNNVLNNLTISSMIDDYVSQKPVRFHMPGHGGIGTDGESNEYFQFDITENNKTDNLYTPNPSGSVDATLKLIERIYNSKASIISAHGATACLQAAIFSCTVSKGKKFILHRKCHVSVINALALCDCEGEYFYDIDDLKEKLSKEPNRTVILTSPDYYGEMLDIRAYSALCRKFSSLLIVDNSHGAHLLWCTDMHPILCEVDYCIDSLHKTTPALTGSAILHSNVASREMMLDAIKLFVSTSPSYLIASSVDKAVRFMDTNGKDGLQQLIKNINIFSQEISAYGIFRETYEIYDPCRITLVSADINGKGFDMRQLCAFLEDNNIVPEFASVEKCVLIPSVFTSWYDFEKLILAIKEFTAGAKTYDMLLQTEYPIAKRATSFRNAVFSKKCRVSTTSAIGSISACAEYVYPPGIPIITPGDIIDEKIITALQRSGITSIDVIDEKS